MSAMGQLCQGHDVRILRGGLPHPVPKSYIYMDRQRIQGAVLDLLTASLVDAAALAFLIRYSMAHESRVGLARVSWMSPITQYEARRICMHGGPKSAMQQLSINMLHAQLFNAAMASGSRTQDGFTPL